MKNNKKLIISLSLATGIFVVILIFDLLSKHFIEKTLPNVGDSMDFLPGFINFVYIQNTGAAWGMLAGRPVFLIIMSLLILALYLWFYAVRLKKTKSSPSTTLSISVGFIVGGCLGNLIDRIAFGYVRDFLNFEFMDFPVFNVADISLTVGIILMVIYFIFIYSKEEKRLQPIGVNIEKYKDDNKIKTNAIQIEDEKKNNNVDKKLENNVSNEDNLQINDEKTDDFFEKTDLKDNITEQDKKTDIQKPHLNNTSSDNGEDKNEG